MTNCTGVYWKIVKNPLGILLDGDVERVLMKFLYVLAELSRYWVPQERW